MGNAVVPRTSLEWVERYHLKKTKVWLNNDEANRLWATTTQPTSNDELIDELQNRDHAYSVFTFQNQDPTSTNSVSNSNQVQTPKKDVHNTPKSPGFKSVDKAVLSPTSEMIYPTLSGLVKNVESLDAIPFKLEVSQLTINDLPPVFDRLAIRLAELFMHENANQWILLEKKLGPKRFRLNLDACRDCVTTELGNQDMITRFLNAVQFEYKGNVLKKEDFVMAVTKGVQLNTRTGIWEWICALNEPDKNNKNKDRKPLPPPGSPLEETLMKNDPRRKQMDPERRKSIVAAMTAADEERKRRIEEGEKIEQENLKQMEQSKSTSIRLQEEERKRRIEEGEKIEQENLKQMEQSKSTSIRLQEEERKRRIEEEEKIEQENLKQMEQSKSTSIKLQEEERKRRIEELNEVQQEIKIQRRRSQELAVTLMEQAKLEKLENEENQTKLASQLAKLVVESNVAVSIKDDHNVENDDDVDTSREETTTGEQKVDSNQNETNVKETNVKETNVDDKIINNNNSNNNNNNTANNNDNVNDNNNNDKKKTQSKKKKRNRKKKKR